LIAESEAVLKIERKKVQLQTFQSLGALLETLFQQITLLSTSCSKYLNETEQEKDHAEKEDSQNLESTTKESSLSQERSTDSESPSEVEKKNEFTSSQTTSEFDLSQSPEHREVIQNPFFFSLLIDNRNEGRHSRST
jgi:hypothetical protein